MTPFSRRDFIKAGLGILGAGFLGGCHAPHPHPESDETKVSSTHPPGSDTLSYKLSPWTGDSFAPMHQIRNGQTPPLPPPSEKFPVVIIGGGLSGLTAAYQLRGESFCLLERETTLGGNAKQGSYQGIDYALGSAYLVDVGPPFGAFYDALGLTLPQVQEPVDSGFDTSLKKFLELSQMKTGQTKGGSHQPKTNTLGSEFERIKGQMTHWLQDPDFPKIPLSDASPQAMKLDDMTFLDYLRGNHYSEALIQYINAYCYSALGGSVSQVSAYSGINFYSEIAGPIYAFPGGNARVGQNLVEKINAAGEHQFRTRVSVYQVEQKPSGKVWVSYLNQATGEATTIECNAVILAIPYFFASRIIPNLPTRWRDILKASQYGSYLVANLCFKERVFTHGYDHWHPLKIAGDKPLPFTDFIDAQYTTDPSHRKAGQVLTVYAPFQEPHMGRGILLQGNQGPLAEGIVSGLQKTLNFPLKTLEEVRLTRYGHQLLTPTPGRMKQLRSLHHQLDEANTPYCFAHSDGQGLPSIESAILQGLKAAEDAKKFLTR